ncbi:MAG: hypothetical protein NZ602_15830 [Thermoguttaceae bacterium]|nr:hypothetical protein [Thermoguttaceae bacterium]MDW8039362.1 hypothetical protein [Thermoguttaceae bacterium]
MEKKYLLACSCGLQQTIEPAQAGQTIRCACGQAIEVPSMLALRRLPLAPSAPVGQVGRWGIRHRLISIGALVMLGAGAWLAVLLLSWPQQPQVPEPITWSTPPPPGKKEPILKTTEQLTLLESYLAWQGLPRQLELVSDAPMTRYKQQVASATNWLIVSVVVGILGLICFASAWLLPGQRLPQLRSTSASPRSSDSANRVPS